jgi:hypothetical protein
MEYFIGSIITIVLMIALSYFSRKLPLQESFTIQTSQSYLFSLIGHEIMMTDINKSKPSQASKYLEKIFIKILIVNGKAYWIKDNVFYVAEMVDQEVDKSTAKEVDIMAMDRVQLKEAMFIIDKLKEDSYNDNWNAG